MICTLVLQYEDTATFGCPKCCPGYQPNFPPEGQKIFKTPSQKTRQIKWINFTKKNSFKDITYYQNKKIPWNRFILFYDFFGPDFFNFLAQ